VRREGRAGFAGSSHRERIDRTGAGHPTRSGPTTGGPVNPATPPPGYSGRYRCPNTTGPGRHCVECVPGDEHYYDPLWCMDLATCTRLCQDRTPASSASPAGIYNVSSSAGAAASASTSSGAGMGGSGPPSAFAGLPQTKEACKKMGCTWNDIECPEVIIADECCIKVKCAGIPILEDIMFLAAVQCWIEKKNCKDKIPHRWELWQDAFWSTIAGSKAVPKNNPTGQIVEDLNPIGAGVGGSTIPPATIFEACYDCTAKENPCSCIDRELRTYKWRDTYSITGPNSNTFVGRMTAYCGLIGRISGMKIIPSGAVGWWYKLSDLPPPYPAAPPSADPVRQADDEELKARNDQALRLRTEYRVTGNKPNW